MLLTMLSEKIDTSGIISTFAGIGTPGYEGDGGLAINAKLNTPYSLAFDDTGNVLITDYGGYDIRKVNTAGIITTIAGGFYPGSGGDGGLAIHAQLKHPAGIVIDRSGNIYFADANNYDIRKINTAGIITTIAGVGVYGYTGDGGLAVNAKLGATGMIAFDRSGSLLITDWKQHVVRRIDMSTNIITTIAGTGVNGYSGDGGLAIYAALESPTGIAIDDNNNIYISDQGANVVRKINVSTGVITTFAGNDSAGYSGDGGLAIKAKLNNENNVTFDKSGNAYVADTYNNRIRKITADTTKIIVNKTLYPGISPNPARTSVTITTKVNFETLTITDALGQTVFSKVYTSTKSTTIDISSYAVGMYFVKLNGVWSEKFVKE